MLRVMAYSCCAITGLEPYREEDWYSRNQSYMVLYFPFGLCTSLGPVPVQCEYTIMNMRSFFSHFKGFCGSVSSHKQLPGDHLVLGTVMTDCKQVNIKRQVAKNTFTVFTSALQRPYHVGHGLSKIHSSQFNLERMVVKLDNLLSKFM